MKQILVKSRICQRVNKKLYSSSDGREVGFGFFMGSGFFIAMAVKLIIFNKPTTG
jgi:hypothetical protein